MNSLQLNRDTLPGLYQSSDQASLKGQAAYFLGLRLYLVLLVAAAGFSFLLPDSKLGASVALALFAITLFILVALKLKRPDDIWYNGRAVAESVKTRAWRWVMRADPYTSSSLAISEEQFTDDLIEILKQNTSLSESLSADAGIQAPISKTMQEIRMLPFSDRLSLYKSQRIDDQAQWYSRKSKFNKTRSWWWFSLSVGLHGTAIAMLIVRIQSPALELPTDAIATAAGATLTWLEAKKHNELTSSYALAAHEIAIIKGKATSVTTEQDLANFVLNSENAFSREHTQWVARKAE